jgi:hypothetical protein
VETGQVDCIGRSLSTGVCLVLISTIEEVIVWQLDPYNFARNKVIYFFEEDMGNICERPNNANKDVIPKYLIEFILFLHDLKKSAVGIRSSFSRNFLVNEDHQSPRQLKWEQGDLRNAQGIL